VAIASALSGASVASDARWEMTVHLAPEVGVELAATTDHARVVLKL
jgi:hypothetical protein